MQLTIPSEPARAVSTAMRILRICFQSGFMGGLWVKGEWLVVRGERLVMSGLGDCQQPTAAL